MEPALYVAGRVVTGVHHGDAYSKLTEAEKDSGILSGFYDPSSGKFLGDGFRLYCKRILLLRHAETDGGRLSDCGRAHCLAAADFLNSRFLDFPRFCSPYERCLETAELLGGGFSVEEDAAPRKDDERSMQFLERVATALDRLPARAVVVSHSDFILGALQVASDAAERPPGLPACSLTYIDNSHAVWVGRPAWE